MRSGRLLFPGITNFPACVKPAPGDSYPFFWLNEKLSIKCSTPLIEGTLQAFEGQSLTNLLRTHYPAPPIQAESLRRLFDETNE